MKPTNTISNNNNSTIAIASITNPGLKQFRSLKLHTISDDIIPKRSINNTTVQSNSTAKTRAAAASLLTKQQIALKLSNQQQAKLLLAANAKKSIATAATAASAVKNKKLTPIEREAADEAEMLSREELLNSILNPVPAVVAKSQSTSAISTAKAVLNRPTIDHSKPLAETILGLDDDIHTDNNNRTTVITPIESIQSSVPSLFSLCIAILGANISAIMQSNIQLPSGTLRAALIAVKTAGLLTDQHIPLIFRTIPIINNINELYSNKYIQYNNNNPIIINTANNNKYYKLDLFGQNKLTSTGFKLLIQLIQFNNTFNIEYDNRIINNNNNKINNKLSLLDYLDSNNNNSSPFDTATYLYLRSIMYQLNKTKFTINYQIIELNLSNCQLLTNENLLLFTTICGSTLLKLIINSCNLITSIGIKSICNNCIILEYLSIEILTKMDDLDIQNILSNCKSLKSLLIGGNLQLSNITYQLISEYCINTLIELSTAGHSQLTDIDLLDISQLNKLQLLDLRSCRLITDSGLLDSIIKLQFNMIRLLDLGGCNRLTNRCIIEILNKFKFLIRLDCRGLNHLTNLIFQSLFNTNNCMNLIEFNVSYCNQINLIDNNETIEIIEKLKLIKPKLSIIDERIIKTD